MAIERSAKRQKLSHSSHEQTAVARLTQCRTDRHTTTARASTHDTTPRSTKRSHDAAAKATSRSGINRSAPSPELSGTPQHVVIEDSEREGTDGQEDEIVVRSSGRARRLPAKLLQKDNIVVARPATASPSIDTTTTAKVKTKIRKSPVVGIKGAAVVEPPAVVQQATKKAASETVKRKRSERPGKENITPPTAATVLTATDSGITTTSDALDWDYMVPSRGDSATEQLDHNVRRKAAELLNVTDDVQSIAASDLRYFRSHMHARATGRTTIPQVDRKEEYAKVSSLVKQAVEFCESNSMLLIGSRGTGKTALVEQVLRAQQKTHADDFHVVRLNGFIHTDDKLALRDIWRQLGREMELDEKETSVRSYADTLSMLLALLSHPLELGQSTNVNQVTKSVIFILDEFDLFATHPRQTLLYNLFDIAQSRKAPIAVLGLTTRVDVVEVLEKRVKSRFSHRYVHLAPARSLTAFTTICKASLEATICDDVSEDAVDVWNAAIETLFANEHFALHIRKTYYRSKSVPDFLTTMLMPLGLLLVEDTLSTSEVIEHFLSTTSMSSLGPDSKLDLLSSLSTLQLALLICAARQNAIYATENVSFNLVYEEYKAIAGKAKLQATASGALGAGSRVWGKDVARNAWADLIDIGLILEDGRGIGKVDIALEEIAGSGVELGQWMKWCKEI